MQKMFGGAIAITALFATSAMAADMAVKAPVYRAPPPPVASWTGCYVGAGGGYGMYDLRTQLTNTVTGAATNVVLDQGGKGWFGTVQVGCDYQIASSWVIGAFADADWSRIRGFHTGQNNSVGLISGEMTLRDSWAAGGRLGYLVTPSLLTYVSAGYTQAKFSGTTYFGFAGLPTGLAVPSQRYNGFFVGGGTEYAMNWFPGLYWKTEYRFADYRSRTLDVFSTTTGLPNGVGEHTHPYVQTIRSELVYRFNWGGGAPVSARY